MGLFTNYNKEAEEVYELWKEEHKEYEEALKKCGKIRHKYRDDFLLEVSDINNMRGDLRSKIKKLYEFLDMFGHTGQKKSYIKDFVLEESIQLDIVENESINLEGTYHRKKETNAYKWVFASLSPTIGGVLILEELRRNHAAKKDYERLIVEQEEARNEYTKHLNSIKDEIKFLKDSIKIAELYRNCIVLIDDAIDNTVLPKLEEIKYFLYADAITNKIINEEIVDNNIIPSGILEFNGTRYHEYYLFIKNAFEYYNLIIEFFTQKILTNIVEDQQITPEEQKTFEKQIREIEKYIQSMKE